MQRYVLTSNKANHHTGLAELHLRNIGKLCAPINNHVFSTRALLENQQENITATLKKLEEVVDTDIRVLKQSNKQPFNIVQVTGSPILAKTMRTHFGKTFTTKDYSLTARKTYGNPSSFIQVDDSVIQAIQKKETYNYALKEIAKKIRNHSKEKSKAQQTRTVNELHKAIQEGKTIKEIQSNKLLYHLPEHLIRERKKIEEINTRLKNENHITIKQKKDYTLDVIAKEKKHILPEENFSYQDCMSQKWLFFDIEIPLWQKEKPEISWVGMNYYMLGQTHKELHTLNEVGEEVFKQYHIVEYDAEADLVLGVRDSIQKQNPYFVAAYNAKFDLLKLREARELEDIQEEFTPDEYGVSRPVLEATVKFFERVGINTREVDDQLTTARANLDFLPNKKLELIAKTLLGEKVFSKSISYDEMEKLELIARRYKKTRDAKEKQTLVVSLGETLQEIKEKSRKASRTIASYVVEDVDIMPKIFFSEPFTNHLQRITEFSQELNIPFRLLNYSPRSMKYLLNDAFFDKTGTHRERLFYNQLKARKEFGEAKQEFRTILERMGNIRAETGMYKQNVHLGYLRYGHFLKDLILKTVPKAELVFNKKARSTADAYLLGRFGNALADWMIADYAIIDKKERQLTRELNHLHLNKQEFLKEFSFQTSITKSVSRSMNQRVYDSKLTTSDLEKTITEDAKKLLQRKNLSIKKWTEIINIQSKIKRTKNKFFKQYLCEFDETTSRLEQLTNRAKEVLKQYQLTPIYQEGPYIYFFGDKSLIQRDFPSLIVHSFNNVLITEDVAFNQQQKIREGKQRLYYNLHEYYKGIKIVNHPDKDNPIFSMNLFRSFYEPLAENNPKQALQNITEQLEALWKGKVPSKNLLWKSKASRRYWALEDGKKIFLRTWSDQRKLADEGKKEGITYDIITDNEPYPHVIEMINNKEEKIILREDLGFRPDFDAYKKKHKDFVLNLTYHLIGEDAINIFPEQSNLFATFPLESATEQLRKKIYF